MNKKKWIISDGETYWFFSRSKPRQIKLTGKPELLGFEVGSGEACIIVKNKLDLNNEEMETNCGSSPETTTGFYQSENMVIDMTITLDQIIHDRKAAYDRKDYAESDRLRAILDQNNIFCFDHPDGSMEVHYRVKPITRKELELELRSERLAMAKFEAWVKTNAG